MRKIFSVRNITILLALVVAAILFVRISSALNTNETAEIEKVKQVRTINTSDYKIQQSKIMAAGEVSASLENEIKAEAGGKIEKIYVKSGDEVKDGQLIAQLDSSSVDIQLAQASAAIERIKAQRNQQASGARNETLQSAQAALDRAKIALLQSQQQLEQTKINGEDAERRALNTVDKINNSMDENYTLTKESTKSAYDNLETTVKNAMTSIDSSMLIMGNMLGEEPGNEYANDSFENVFGAKSQTQREDFKQAFIDFREKFEIFRNRFNEIKGNFSDPEALTQFSLDIENQLRQIGDLLEDNRITLENTITQGAFDDKALTALKNQVSGAITANNNQFGLLSSSRQRIRDVVVRAETTQNSLFLDLTKAKEDVESVKEQSAKSLEIARKAIQIQETAVKQAELTVEELKNGPRSIDLAALDASIKEAQAAYELMLKNKDKTSIKAAFSGTIAEVNFKEGELISPGQTITTLISSSQIEVKAYISSTDREFINSDSKVTINESIEGNIKSISPRLDPKKKKIEVAIAIDQNLGLNIGEFVEVSFENESSNNEDRFFLPFRAIRNTPEGAFVLKVDSENKIEAIAIQLGKVVGEQIEVISGLNNDMEIIESTRGLNDSEKVEVAANSNTSKIKVDL